MTDSNSNLVSARIFELAEEFLERYRRGQRPSLREYIDRHPDLAQEIREVFPAMAILEKVAIVDEALATHHAPVWTGPSVGTSGENDRTSGLSTSFDEPDRE